jgi:hypothetical protein
MSLGPLNIGAMGDTTLALKNWCPSSRRAAKPTARPADLPFQREGRRKRTYRDASPSHGENIRVPRDKWTRLQLWIWRLQQKCAIAFRRLKQALSKVGARQAWTKIYSNRWTAGVLDERLPGETWEVEQRVGGGYRKVTVKAPDTTRLEEGLNELTRGGGLKSTVLRRGFELARNRLLGVAENLRNVYEVSTLAKCLVCGGPHGTLACFAVLDRSLDREDDNIQVVTMRLALGATQLERVEDMGRLAVSRRRKEQLRRARYMGLAHVAYSCLRIGVTPASLGALRPILSLPALADDVLYLLSGRRFAFARWRVQDLMNALFAVRGLVDYLERESASAAEMVEPEEHSRDTEQAIIQFGGVSSSRLVGQREIPSREELNAVETDLLSERRVLDERRESILRFAVDEQLSGLGFTGDTMTDREVRIAQGFGINANYVGLAHRRAECIDCGRVMYVVDANHKRPWFWRSCDGCDAFRPRLDGRLL